MSIDPKKERNKTLEELLQDSQTKKDALKKIIDKMNTNSKPKKQ